MDDDFISESDWEFISDRKWEELNQQKANILKELGSPPLTNSLETAIDGFAELLVVLGA